MTPEQLTPLEQEHYDAIFNNIEPILDNWGHYGGMNAQSKKEAAAACAAITLKAVEEDRKSRWIPVTPETKLEQVRYLCFSPVYKEGDPMRYRILDAQFIKTATEVTHIMKPSAPNPLSTNII